MPKISDDTIERNIRDEFDKLVDISNAMTWSFEPGMGEIGIARFGTAIAVDGEPFDGSFEDARKMLREEGFEKSGEKGGKIPTSEAEVSADTVAFAVADDLGVSVERVFAVMEEMGFTGKQLYSSSSGYAEVFVKTKDDENNIFDTYRG